jgi:hypothetical protein
MMATGDLETGFITLGKAVARLSESRIEAGKTQDASQRF